MAQTTDSGVSLARDLVWVLEEVRRYDPDMPIQTLTTFFLVAERPGIRIVDIARVLDLSGSSVSRNVLALSSRHWRRGPDGKFLPGLDLVVAVSDPTDTRTKLVTLTPRGRKLLERLTARIRGTNLVPSQEERQHAYDTAR